MADIFLSYARDDTDRARLYAQAFGSLGWTVFWDPQIVPGSTWDEVIEEQLDQCWCVVVLWSAVSVKKKWVKNEATVGDERGVLVPVSIAAVQPPLGFRHRQSAQLQHWQGDLEDDRFAQLLKGIERHVPRVGLGRERAAAADHADYRPPAAAVDTPGSRFREDAWFLPDDALLGFVEIPAGRFTVGSDWTKDSRASLDELPAHPLTVPSFFIGRYEVTVEQYKAFTRDSGSKPGNPRVFDGAGDLPVRYVSWHEALAYCMWLEEKLKSRDQTPDKLADALARRHDGRTWHVTLPSEAEWERAARGTEGRLYPWGDRIDPTKANYAAAKRGGSTPVGSFPAGATPEGLLDMGGNVWEWTRSHFRPYPYQSDDGRENLKAGDDVPRVVRGGSFVNGERFVRAARRNGNNPDYRLDYIGFRVVVSPFAR